MEVEGQPTLPQHTHRRCPLTFLPAPPPPLTFLPRPPCPALPCPAPLQDEAGRVVGAAVRDALTGRELEVFARTVINATGPFSDELRHKSQVGGEEGQPCWIRFRAVPQRQR